MKIRRSLTVFGCALLVTSAAAQRTRTLPLRDVFRGPGQTALQPGEVLVRVTVPKAAGGSGGAYLRHVPRREMDIAVVGVAVHLQMDQIGRAHV